MIPTVEQLHEREYLSDLDLHFARAMGRLAGEKDELAVLGAAVASRFTFGGHVCVDLEKLCGLSIATSDGRVVEDYAWPDASAWLASLRASALVGEDTEHKPLIVDAGGRLYLNRYWGYQQGLAKQLRLRATGEVEAVDPGVLRDGLDRLFPRSDQSPDRQRLAALVAVVRRLTVISGGPGTGKTSTVVKLLVLLLEQARAAGREFPRILMMAPTGKAAARLGESIRNAKTTSTPAPLGCDEQIKAAIPDEPTTIHRALGYQPNRSGRFRHDASNPLAADVVLVDEASMVDLALMTRLVDAVPSNARLILLGDKDQLASVEAGAILGDICSAAGSGGLSREFVTRLEELTGESLGVKATSVVGTGIRDCITTLTHSYRFDASSGIGQLARAINDADEDAAMACLRDDAFSDVHFLELRDLKRVPVEQRAGARRDYEKRLGEHLRGLVEAHYRAYLDVADPALRLEHFDRFRILCAHRKGMTGVESLNSQTESVLERCGALSLDREWYSGRPVMVSQNDYQMQLFNGDVGLIGPDPQDASTLQVFFSLPDGSTRAVSPSRLPPHGTVFAMTVHKSQGSEFDHVVVVLPEQSSPVVTRELLYTAVTRAKKSVYVCGSEALVREAARTPVLRASGLRASLLLE